MTRSLIKIQRQTYCISHNFRVQIFSRIRTWPTISRVVEFAVGKFTNYWRTSSSSNFNRNLPKTRHLDVIFMYYVLGEIYSRVVIFAVRDAFAKFAKIKPPRKFQLVQYIADWAEPCRLVRSCGRWGKHTKTWSWLVSVQIGGNRGEWMKGSMSRVRSYSKCWAGL